MSGFSRASGARGEISKGHVKSKERKTAKPAGGSQCTADSNKPANEGSLRLARLATLFARFQTEALPTCAEEGVLKRYVASMGQPWSVKGQRHEAAASESATDSEVHLRWGPEVKRAMNIVVTRLRQAGWDGVKDPGSHKPAPFSALLVKALAGATPPVPAAIPRRKAAHSPRVKHSGHGDRVYEAPTQALQHPR